MSGPQTLAQGWTTLIVDADGNPCVPEHSRVVRGVLCRWWGDEQPEGVSIIDRAADYDALAAQLAEAGNDLDLTRQCFEEQAEELRQCIAQLAAAKREREVWKRECELMAAHQGIDNFDRIMTQRFDAERGRDALREALACASAALAHDRSVYRVKAAIDAALERT